MCHTANDPIHCQRGGATPPPWWGTPPPTPLVGDPTPLTHPLAPKTVKPTLVICLGRPPFVPGGGPTSLPHTVEDSPPFLHYWEDPPPLAQNGDPHPPLGTRLGDHLPHHMVGEIVPCHKMEDPSCSSRCRGPSPVVARMGTAFLAERPLATWRGPSPLPQGAPPPALSTRWGTPPPCR